MLSGYVLGPSLGLTVFPKSDKLNLCDFRINHADDSLLLQNLHYLMEMTMLGYLDEVVQRDRSLLLNKL